MKSPLIIGHRGAAGRAPENTLLAVETGIALGVDWIEIDVYAVADELVVIHDNTLERTTNGMGEVMGKSLRYLRSLDAGQGEKIPFLYEVIALVDRRVGINIELKGPDTAAPVVQLIKQYLQQGWDYSQFIISSFDHRELKKVHALDPLLPIGILLYGVPLHFLQFSSALPAYSVHFSSDFVDDALVKAARQQGFKVFVYTVNHKNAFLQLQKLQLDGFFTDYPDILHSAIDR